MEVAIVDHFILLHHQQQTAATLSLGLGLMMTGVIAVHPESAHWVKETAILMMIVPLDSPVVLTTVERFIPMLTVLPIVATISQVLGLPMTIIFALHPENAQLDKETVTATMIVPLDLLVDMTTAKAFMSTLNRIMIVVMISQVLGLVMTVIIAAHPENALRDKEIVTVIMTVPPDSCVEQTTAGSFIPTLNGIMIVATISQGSVLTMTGVIARHPEDAVRDKETVIVTVTVQLVLYVGRTTAKSSIPRLSVQQTVVCVN